MILPTLYKLTSTGKIQTWKIETIVDRFYPDSGKILVTYGLQGGKQQTAYELIREGKNIGKSNETTPLEQAELEAKAQWELKKRKKYVENLEDAAEGKVDTNSITGGIDPMLAQSYDKHASKIVYPAYVQPKLDGHRCIAIIQDGVCTLWSRTRKPIKSMPHIVAQLEGLFAGISSGAPHSVYILDGELYNHDYRDKFEELTSFIRQENPKPGHEVVQYWIYDTPPIKVSVGWHFKSRTEMLSQLEERIKENTALNALKIVDTQEVQDEEEMFAVFDIYIDYGFEGLMLRNKVGLYKNRRSYDLQKVKTMVDSEFEIIDITQGVGKMAGKAMFHVLTPEGKEFRVKMIGTLDSLAHYYEHKDQYIGQQLTVKFQKLSAEDRIPIFPIGMRVRAEL